MILPVERKTRENLVVQGHRYDKEIFKITLPSGRKIKIYGSTYQCGCNTATIMSFQNRESLMAQEAPKELIQEIDNKVFVGPPIGEEMSIIRYCAIMMMKARYLQQDPKTKTIGEEMDVLIQKQKDYYGPLYNIDWKNLKINP